MLSRKSMAALALGATFALPAAAELSAADLAKLGTTLTPVGAEKAGNAAGTGARIALLDNASRTKIEELVRQVEKIETAIEPRFQEHFVQAMGIPHSTAEYVHLRKAVSLPAPKAAAPRTNTRSHRRRADT